MSSGVRAGPAKYSMTRIFTGFALVGLQFHVASFEAALLDVTVIRLSPSAATAASETTLRLVRFFFNCPPDWFAISCEIFIEGNSVCFQIQSNSSAYQYLYTTVTLDNRKSIILLSANMSLCKRCRCAGDNHPGQTLSTGFRE